MARNDDLWRLLPSARVDELQAESDKLLALAKRAEPR